MILPSFNTLHLMFPDELPVSKAQLSELLSTRNAGYNKINLLDYLGVIDEETALKNLTLLDFDVSELLLCISKNQQLTPVSHVDPMKTATDDSANIKRATGDPIFLLSQSALGSFHVFVQELNLVGTKISDKLLNAIFNAYKVIFEDLLLVEPQSGDQFELKTQNLSFKPELLSGVRRWVIGHHLFMVMIQWQIIYFNSYVKSLNNDDQNKASDYLRTSTVLMQGVTAAFTFVSDISFSEYTDSIRSHLLPPVAPEGMSGLFWEDHIFFVKVLRSVPKNKLMPILSTDLALFEKATNETYEAHKFVCGNFVGYENSSLRSSQSGVEVLEKYKKSRLKTIVRMRNND